MKKINLHLKDEVYDSLERDFKNFVRISLKCDAGFITPTFDSFILTKISDNTNYLTEDAVQHLMNSGQYAWAKRALDKDFPDVVAILIEQASTYGFHIAVHHDWDKNDVAAAAKAWAAAIIKQAQGDETQVDVLASQIKSAAVNITVVEDKVKTPAARMAHSLGQQLHDAKIAVEHAHGAVAREKLGALRCLLKLAVAYGSIQEIDEMQYLHNLKLKKPSLFEESQEGFLASALAWWRSVLG